MPRPRYPSARSAWLCLLLLLSGCASLSQVQPAVPTDKALVYVYRRAIPVGPEDLHIYDGQKDLGSLGTGSDLHYLADPGPRIFKAVAQGSGSMPYATTLVSGRTYYLVAYFLGNEFKSAAALTPMDEASAKAQMAALKDVSQP